MPGLYINDGGATASALGNAIGGIAADFSPKTIADAALLRQQTEAANWANREASSRVPAEETAAGNAPGLLSTFGANAAPPETVAGTAAALAQPPATGLGSGATARGVLNTSGMTPFQSYVANEIVHGRMSPDALTTTVTKLGQPAVGGPGSDYGTQTEIAKAGGLANIDITKAQSTPQHVATGDTLVVNPRLGPNAPGNTIYGGSPVDLEVQATTAKDAQTDQKNGVQANDALARLSALQALRNTVVQGHFTPGDILFDEAAKHADDAFGTHLFSRSNNRIEVLNAIRGQMKSITAATRLQYAGDPSLRGLAAQLDDALPDPDSNEFDNSVNALKKTLGVTVDDANAANDFLPHVGSPIAAQEYRSGKLARHAAAAAAAAEALKAGAGAGAGTGSATGAGPPAPPGGTGGSGSSGGAVTPPTKRWKWNPATGRTEPQ